MENQNIEAVVEVAVVAEAKPTLSPAEKLQARAAVLAARITKDTEEYNGIANQLNNAAALASLEVGSVVTFKMGRKFADKDTTRVVEAKIIAAATKEDGSTLYKVAYGEGFDAEVAVITVAQIITVL